MRLQYYYFFKILKRHDIFNLVPSLRHYGLTSTRFKSCFRLSANISLLRIRLKLSLLAAEALITSIWKCQSLNYVKCKKWSYISFLGFWEKKKKDRNFISFRKRSLQKRCKYSCKMCWMHAFASFLPHMDDTITCSIRDSIAST